MKRNTKKSFLNSLSQVVLGLTLTFRLVLLICSWSIFLSQNCGAVTDICGELTSIPIPSGNTTINAAITELLSPDSQRQANALRVLTNTSDERAAIPILHYMSKPIEVEGSESATVHFQLKIMAIEAFKANSGLQFPAVDPRNRPMWDAAIQSAKENYAIENPYSSMLQILGRAAPSQIDAQLNTFLVAAVEKQDGATLYRLLAERYYGISGRTCLQIKHLPQTLRVQALILILPLDSFWALLPDDDYKKAERDLRYNALVSITGKKGSGWNGANLRGFWDGFCFWKSGCFPGFPRSVFGVHPQKVCLAL